MEHRPIGDVTAADWDMRFGQQSWAEAGGNMQSLLFYRKALETLRSSPYKHLLDLLDNGAFSLHDYGCAEGDGTAFLKASFPLARIKGFDFSPVGVERACRRWPTVPFALGDIRQPAENASIIWTSHTLEHMTNPVQVVQTLLKRCSWLVVIVPPVPEHDTSESHTGAVPINTWINQLPHPPLLTRYFVTVRVDPSRENALMWEESYLFLFHGQHTWLW